MRGGRLQFTESESRVQPYGVILVERAQSNWNATILRLPLQTAQQVRAEAPPLVTRVNHQLPNVDVTPTILHRPVPAANTVDRYDFMLTWLPCVGEERILALLIPRAELALYDIAVCRMMRVTGKLRVGVGRLSDLDSQRRLFARSPSKAIAQELQHDFVELLRRFHVDNVPGAGDFDSSSPLYATLEKVTDLLNVINVPIADQDECRNLDLG